MKLANTARLASAILLMFSLVCVASAESNGVGLKFGLNIADQTGSDHFFMRDFTPEGGSDNRLGFCLGGFYAWRINEWLSFQTEALLSVKGSKFTSSGSVTYTDSVGFPYTHIRTWDNSETWKLSYLEVPLLAKFYLPAGQSLRPNLFVGPALSINLSSQLDWKWEGRDHIVSSLVDSVWYEASKDDIDDLKTLEFCLVAGIGADFLLSESAMTLDVRYTLSLTSNDSYTAFLSKEEWGRIRKDDLNVKNKVISIILGYAF